MTTSLALLKASSAGVNRSDTACPAPSPSGTASSVSCPVAEGVADISVCRSVICSQGDCSMADSRGVQCGDVRGGVQADEQVAFRIGLLHLIERALRHEPGQTAARGAFPPWRSDWWPGPCANPLRTGCAASTVTSPASVGTTVVSVRTMPRDISLKSLVATTVSYPPAAWRSSAPAGSTMPIPARPRRPIRLRRRRAPAGTALGRLRRSSPPRGCRCGRYRPVSAAA